MSSGVACPSKYVSMRSSGVFAILGSHDSSRLQFLFDTLRQFCTKSADDFVERSWASCPPCSASFFTFACPAIGSQHEFTALRVEFAETLR